MYCSKYKIKNISKAKLKVDMGRDKPTYDRFVLLFEIKETAHRNAFNTKGSWASGKA